MQAARVVRLCQLRCDHAPVPEERRLVSTGDAARHIGVDRSTLGRWVAAGYVRPTRKTIGGQYRWDLDDLEEQLRAAEAKGDEGPPFAAELADKPRHPEEPQ